MDMKKAQEKPIKKESLLDAAFELMMAKGYVATSVDEICEKAKTTKGSFFHYFESKEELAKALLTRKCTAQQRIKEELFGKDPYKRVFGHLDMLIEMIKRPSGAKACIKGMLGQELSDTHPEIRKICAAHFENVTNDFAQDLADAKKQYGGNFEPVALAKHFIAVLQGSYILAKVQGNNNVVIENLEYFKKYLQTLIKKVR
jgi:TetR/AcrR family transcriptional regulator, transcriptional repressor for nem operon